MNKCVSLPLAILTIAVLFPASAAAAGPEACGNLELTAIGECHLEYSGGCKAKCEPVRLVAACDGQCNASLDVECSTSCGASCQGSCEADPGSFDCRASCQSDCSATISARCGDDQECVSYCEADCSTQCEAECNVVPPSASCDAQCEACCGGSCEVDANFDCSLQCSADLQGGCEVACDQPEGALFCDGQYIAVTDLPECVSYLVENFSVDLEFEASASATADISGCSVTERRTGGVGGGLAFIMLGLASMMWRRRERK